MAKEAKEKADTRRLPVTLSAVTHAYLSDLARAGIYGTRATEVAKSLIEQGIRDAITNKFLKLREKTSSEPPPL